MLWHPERCIALVAGFRLSDFDIVPGVTADQVETLGDFGLGLEFHTLGTNLTFLAGEAVDVLRGVLFGEVEPGNGVEAVGPWWLVLETQFVLLANLRIKLRVVSGNTHHRQKRFAVAGIGCQAIVEEIDNAGATAELLILLGLRSAAVILVAGPVVTTTQEEHPLVDLQLVLQVDTGLRHFLFVAVGTERKERQWLAVDRIEHVEAFQDEVQRLFLIKLAVVVVDAGQQRVFERTRGEVGLNLIIHGEQMTIALSLIVIA
ncbi:hypothetical protein D3C73_813420 [compost metagenome]